MHEQLMEGITALIAGMGTVFAILILISVVISLFKYINIEKKVFRELAVSATEAGSAEDKDLEEMNRVVAAISVALATKLKLPADQLVVRNIKRVKG